MAFVVHCKRDPFDVYIGRPSKWGNPFIIGTHGTREEVIEQYIEWLEARPGLVYQAMTELRGMTLGCWCAPQACHGDVLASIANANALRPPKPGDAHIYITARGGRSHWHGCRDTAVMECRFTMKDAESWLVAGALDELW